MSSTTSRRLKRVYELLEAAGEAGNGLIRTADLEAALKGKPYPMPTGLNPDFPFKAGDVLPTDTTTEWLESAPIGTQVEDCDLDLYTKTVEARWENLALPGSPVLGRFFNQNGYTPVTIIHIPTDPRTIPA